MPRWPKRSLYVPKPRARPRIWLPKQMPKNGTFAARTARSVSTACVADDGSPGPFEKKTPSGFIARISSAVMDDGTTLTLTPRRASNSGVIDLMPRSTATTWARVGVPFGGRSRTPRGRRPRPRDAPPPSGWLSLTRATSSSAGARASPEKIPARITPALRRMRTSSRVSMPEIPTIPWARRSSSRLRCERQLDGRRAGSRTTYPATQIRPDSTSSSFMPVLPMCGAVITTICRWYDGSVSVSWYPVMPVLKTISPVVAPRAP